MNRQEFFDSKNFVSNRVKFRVLGTQNCYACGCQEVVAASGHVHLNDGQLTHILTKYCAEHRNEKKEPIDKAKLDCEGIGCNGWWKPFMGIRVENNL